MDIRIQTSGFKLNPCIRGFVTGKFARLAELYHAINTAEIMLSSIKTDNPEHCICEISLLVPGHQLFARKSGETFEDAIRDGIAALKKQIGSISLLR